MTTLEPGTQLEERPIPWLELLETVFRRRRWILLGGLLGLLGGLGIAATRAPLFRATARIQLTAQAVSGPRKEGMSDQQIQAELALLKTPALIRSVLEDRAPPTEDTSKEDSKALGRWIRSVRLFAAERWASLHNINPTAAVDHQIQKIAGNISAVPVGRSNLVEISYLSEEPEQASQFVNDLLHRHVERIAELNERGSARPLYEDEKKEALERWQKAGERLAQFREDQGTSLLAGDEEQVRNHLAILQSQKVAAETQLLELKARSKFLSSRLSELPRTIDAEWTVTQDQSVQLLKQRILELEIQRSEALSQFTSRSKIVRDLDGQIAEATRLLETKEGATLSETTTTLDPSYQALEVDLVQTQAQITSSEARVAALFMQIDIYRERLLRLEQSAGELDQIEDEVSTAREQYRRYAEQEEQARVTAMLGELGFVNVSIVDAASVPSTPLPRRTWNRLLLAFLAGLLLGLGSAFAADALNPTVKGWRQAERLSKVPAIGVIPGT